MKRKELLDAILKVKKGIAVTDIIEQADKIIFDNDTIRSYNDEISFLVPFETGIRCAVPTKELLTYLKKGKTEDVSLSIDNGMLLVKGNRGKAGLHVNENVVLPFEDLEIKSDWKTLPNDFLEGVEVASFSVSNNAITPVLNYLNVDGEYMYSCDNKRVTKYKMDSPVEDSLMIHRVMLSELIKYNAKQYALGNGWLHFKTDDGVVLSVRTTGMTYPDVNKFLDFDGIRVRLPKNTNEALDEVFVFSYNEMLNDHRIFMIFDNNTVKFKATGKNGFAEAEGITRYSGEPRTIIVNPIFLKDMYKLEKTIIVTGNCLCIDNEKIKHITLLITVGDK